MSFRFHWIIALFVVLAMQGCANRLEVRVDYDPKENFETLKTYAWAPATDAERQEKARNSLMHDRIRAAIDTYLSAHGYQKVAEAKADFLVTHTVTVKRQAQVYDSRVSIGYGRYSYRSGVGIGFGFPATTHVEEYEVGTLIIDIINVSQNRLVWRGSGERILDEDATPEKRTEVINATVNEILNRFPPKPKDRK